MIKSSEKRKENISFNKRDSSEKKRLKKNNENKKLFFNNFIKTNFYSELKRKYENEKDKSPSKFNITPLRRKAKPILKKTPIKIKEINNSEHKNNSNNKNSSSKKYLGKKRGISFNHNKLVKEFNPKTPVKEISKSGIRFSPVERKELLY